MLDITDVTKEENNSTYCTAVCTENILLYVVQLLYLTIPFSQKLKRHLTIPRKFLMAELFPAESIYIKTTTTKQIAQLRKATRLVA